MAHPASTCWSTCCNIQHDWIVPAQDHHRYLMMGAILLWLAELVGGAAFKLVVSRWLFRKSEAASPALTAEASRAEATAAEQAQELKGEQTRDQVDQSVTNNGVAAARNDLRDNWTKP